MKEMAILTVILCLFAGPVGLIIGAVCFGLYGITHIGD